MKSYASLVADSLRQKGLKDPEFIRFTAAVFSKFLREDIGAEKLALAVKRNRKEKSGLVCHSHDFCDANMTMLDAMIAVGVCGPEEDFCISGADEEKQTFWNSVWESAKKEEFSFSRVGGSVGRSEMLPIGMQATEVGGRGECFQVRSIEHGLSVLRGYSGRDYKRVDFYLNGDKVGHIDGSVL